MNARCFLLLGAALLSGCQAMPWARHAETDSAPVVPAAWRGAAGTASSLGERDWREIFGTGELATLIEEALVANSDLNIARERIAQAQSQLTVQRSLLFPTLAMGAAYQRERAPGLLSENTDSELGTFGLSAPSWEIDLWGRLRDLNEAARQNFLATAETQSALRSSIVAQVALAYVDLLELDAEQQVADATLVLRQKSMQMVQLRFDAGVAAGVDLQQARTSLAATERALADIARRRERAENTLAVLIGRNPGAVKRATQLKQLNLPATLNAGLPASLLARRPDIRAAERTLAATRANVEAARKAFFPSISLTGFLGVVSPELSRLFVGGREAFSVNPQASLPIFTAGRLTASLEAERSQQRIAAEAYRQTVRNAFLEVENALIDYQRSREQRLALDTTVSADRERLRLVELRYHNGVSSHFELLDAQRELFSAELAQVQATSLSYSAVIQLYRALGGGWDQQAQPTGGPQADRS
jgi:multidrug efflux system outer membrane protein